MKNITDMMQRVTGGDVDHEQVADAAADHIDSLDESQVKEHVQQAAENASQSGNTGVAQQLTGLLSRFRSDPAAAKDEAVSLIKQNPQLLSHFAPEFAQGILGRLGD